MTRKKTSDQRVCYSIHDVLDDVEKVRVDVVLFAHAFTGCDTTSAIHHFGKESIFLKLESSKPLRTIAQQFLLDDMSP